MIEPLNLLSKKNDKVGLIFLNGTSVAVFGTTGERKRSGQVNAGGAAIMQV